MKAVSILGAGGHTRSSITLLKQYGYNIAGLYDPSFVPGKEEVIRGIRLCGPIDDEIPGPLFLSIGDVQRRAALYEQYASKVLSKTLTHQSALIEEDVELGLQCCSRTV